MCAIAICLAVALARRAGILIPAAQAAWAVQSPSLCAMAGGGSRSGRDVGNVKESGL